MGRIIDVEATGKNIRKLMDDRNLKVRDVQYVMGLESPRAIYKWLSGDTMPTVDHLVILADYLGVTLDDIIVTQRTTGTVPAIVCC